MINLKTELILIGIALIAGIVVMSLFFSALKTNNEKENQKINS